MNLQNEFLKKITLYFPEVLYFSIGKQHFIRTSVDHGTALDIAGSGLVSADSLVAATRLAIKLANHKLADHPHEPFV